MQSQAIGWKLWETTLRPIASGQVIISVICYTSRIISLTKNTKYLDSKYFKTQRSSFFFRNDTCLRATSFCFMCAYLTAIFVTHPSHPSITSQHCSQCQLCNHVNGENHVNNVNHVNSVNSVNSVNTVNSISSVERGATCISDGILYLCLANAIGTKLLPIQLPAYTQTVSLLLHLLTTESRIHILIQDQI